MNIERMCVRACVWERKTQGNRGNLACVYWCLVSKQLSIGIIGKLMRLIVVCDDHDPNEFSCLFVCVKYNANSQRELLKNCIAQTLCVCCQNINCISLNQFNDVIIPMGCNSVYWSSVCYNFPLFIMHFISFCIDYLSPEKNEAMHNLISIKSNKS